MNRIRLVTFDVLHTIITPRLPIYVQYSQVFEPYVGRLPPERLKASFKTALQTVQIEHPAYPKGARAWWKEVIRRTALSAGASEKALDNGLDTIVDELMTRFSSRAGYKAFDDAIPTIRYLQETLGIRTAVISNGDSRLKLALEDLGFPDKLEPIVLSEELGIEKPSPGIFLDTLSRVNEGEVEHMEPGHVLHVGDDLACDYYGATKAGFHGALLRRHGKDGEGEAKSEGEDLRGVRVVHTLHDIVNLCKTNKREIKLFVQAEAQTEIEALESFPAPAWTFNCGASGAAVGQFDVLHARSWEFMCFATRRG